VLTLPSEAYMAEQLDVVDPQKIHAVREAMKLQLAQALRDDWAWAFEATRSAAATRPIRSRPASARSPTWRCRCCAWTRSDGDAVWPGRAYQRFKDAGNMTDRLGALSALVLAMPSWPTPALSASTRCSRTRRWSSTSGSPAGRAPEKDGRVFARAKQLLKHPDFSLKNPNRARSLISSLCMNNPAAFHRTDAAGYVFWADRILELDASTRSSPPHGARDGPLERPGRALPHAPRA
jgi:aminopeptidase N